MPLIYQIERAFRISVLSTNFATLGTEIIQSHPEIRNHVSHLASILGQEATELDFQGSWKYVASLSIHRPSHEIIIKIIYSHRYFRS